MKNPLMEQEKERWDADRSSGDSSRVPLRSLQTASPDVMLQDLRLRIHRRLIDTLDLSKLSNLEMERVRVEIRRSQTMCRSIDCHHGLRRERRIPARRRGERAIGVTAERHLRPVRIRDHHGLHHASGVQLLRQSDG